MGVMAIQPLDIGNGDLDRAQRLAGLVSIAKPEPVSAEADLLRSVWAVVGTAVDSYFHERVRRGILDGGLLAKGKKFQLPLGGIELIRTDVNENRDVTTRPRVALTKAIQDQLGYEAFQGHRNIEKAIDPCR